jgi:hypothetical protein
MTDGKWTKRCTDWKPDRKKRMGSPRTQWRDKITQTAGEEWTHQAEDRDQWRDMMEVHIQLWTDMG